MKSSCKETSFPNHSCCPFLVTDLVVKSEIRNLLKEKTMQVLTEIATSMDVFNLKYTDLKIQTELK